MDKSFPMMMVAMMTAVVVVTVWLTKRLVQPPTEAGKKPMTIFLCFVVAESVILTAIVLLSVEHLLQPRLLGILGLVNLVGAIVILPAALKRAPITEQDVTQAQRERSIKSSKLLIAFFAFGLLNALFHLREYPVVPLTVGVAVNVLILAALIIHVRRNQAKLTPTGND